MVSHFHYDPVWWNTQGGFTEVWHDCRTCRRRRLRPPYVRTAFDLVRAHLDAARHDDDYRFVLAEIDYLKPYWDAVPDDRTDLRRLLPEGRVELVGGSYNEPNTNLTHPESTIRNAVYGVGYQRDVLGGDPRSAWMLDVFGHDPAFPGLMADAGLTSSAWARGPFHIGAQPPHRRHRAHAVPREFEWISPNGRGLLTAYMANHYGAGWDMETSRRSRRPRRGRYGQFASCARSPPPATSCCRSAPTTSFRPLVHRGPPRLEQALRLAALHRRPAARLLRRRTRGAGSDPASRRRRRPAT